LGSDIIIPSSTLAHGNTPIQLGEWHVSFTQYCSGGLFHWVAYGFQKDCTLKKLKLKEKVDGQAGSCWEKALALVRLMSSG
jgi:hypothetical protein